MTDTATDLRRLLRRDRPGVAVRQPDDDAVRIAARWGIAPEWVVRLHMNENPYGTPLRVQEALASFDQYHLYPDTEQTALRRLLADYTGLDPARIVVGNGAAELIDDLCLLFIDQGDVVILPDATLGFDAARIGLFGATCRVIPRRPDFTLDIDAMEAEITPATKLVLLASPNNPSGNLCRERDIVRLLRREVIVVVDEAYFEFGGRTVAPLIREFDNLVVLRTLSHWAGLAGLPLSYALVPRWVAAEARRVQQPYGVNAAAQIAAEAIFTELPYFRNMTRRIRLERLRMYRALRKLNFVRPLESKANFLLLDVLLGTPAALVDWLAQDGIIVRGFAEPALSRYVRISVGKSEDTDRLMRRMTELARRYAREMPR